MPVLYLELLERHSRTYNNSITLKEVHFHDLEKNATPERIELYRKAYTEHIRNVIG